MRGAEAWACGAVQTRGLAGGREGAKSLLLARVSSGFTNPGRGHSLRRAASGDADGVCVVG